MSDQNAYGAEGHVQTPYGGTDAATTPHRFIDQASSVAAGDERGVEPQAGLGAFTLREWIVIALGLTLTVLSFFSAFSLDVISGYTPVWAVGITWLGAAFFPFVAVLLIALRRFVPRLRSLGALSLDQLASVAFAVAAFLWLNLAIIVLQISAAIQDLYAQFAAAPDAVDGVFDLQQSPLRVGVIVWIALVVALAGVFFTVFARFIPPFSADFAGREQTPAHPTARPVRPLAKRARPAAHPAAAPQATPPTWPGGASAPHGGFHPAYAPSPSASPTADGGVPPVPRPHDALSAQGAYAPYGQQSPSSSDQQAAPPYARHDGQHTTAPAHQGDPAPHADQAPTPAAWPTPSEENASPAPEHGAPAPTEQVPVADVPHAAPVSREAADVPNGPLAADASSSEANPVPTAEGQPGETPADGTDVAPYEVPVDDAAPDAVVAPVTDAPDPAPAGDRLGAVEDDATVLATMAAAASEDHDAATPPVDDAEVADASSAPAADSGDPAVAFGAPPTAAVPADVSTAPAPEAAAPVTPQPFWALAPVERDVHDFDGNAIYRIGPTAWALVLEDRGSYFVMRHDDGRIGYLHDTSGITRG